MLGSLLTVCASVSGAVRHPAGKSAAQPPALHPIEARVIEKTNSQRARHGLPPLAVDHGSAAIGPQITRPG